MLFLGAFVQINAIDLTLNTSAVHNATSGLFLLADTPSGTNLNPAYISQGLESGVTYLFNFTELPLYNFHAAKGWQKLGFYFGGSHLKHPYYSETLMNIAVNYRKSYLAAGTSLRFLHTRVTNYLNADLFMLDAGFVVFHDNITTGISIRNLSRTRFRNNVLPVVILWELNYKISELSSISLGLEKEREYDFSFKTGAFYRIHPYIAFLTSYQYEPDRIGAGVILLPAPFRITYSVLTHRYLSPTHYVSLTYE